MARHLAGCPGPGRPHGLHRDRPHRHGEVRGRQAHRASCAWIGRRSTRRSAPRLYGFVPRTLCAERGGRVRGDRAGRPRRGGRRRPMDVCVLTEREINRGGIIVTAPAHRRLPDVRRRGGGRQDPGRAGGRCGLRRLPRSRRLPARASWSGSATISSRTRTCRATEPRHTEITHVYGAAEAREVVRYSLEDYRRRFEGAGP